MLVVLHVITGLGRGGAEAVLSRLVQACGARCQHIVVSLTDEGVYGAALRGQGVEVHSLRWQRGRMGPQGLWRLWQLVRATRPDVVQTWMYHADLVGGVMARLAGSRAVVWGIRNSDLDPQRSSRSAQVAMRWCAWLSAWLPRAIVSCSVRAQQVHAAMGYRSARFQVIPNGYDLNIWREHPASHMAQRARWGVAGNALVLGMVARWDPQKDHATLLDALALVVRTVPRLTCVLAGPGMQAENASLSQAIAERGLQAHLVLDGPRNDVPEIMAALDLHVLSSAYGEAFPNVVAEAMACGTPCVVTDVGDASAIVGDVGWVVPRQDGPALAAAILSAISAVQGDERQALRAACRARIAADFGLDRMVEAYLELWSQLRPARD